MVHKYQRRPLFTWLDITLAIIAGFIFLFAIDLILNGLTQMLGINNGTHQIIAGLLLIIVLVIAGIVTGRIIRKSMSLPK